MSQAAAFSAAVCRSRASVQAVVATADRDACSVGSGWASSCGSGAALTSLSHVRRCGSAIYRPFRRPKSSVADHSRASSTAAMMKWCGWASGPCWAAACGAARASAHSYFYFHTVGGRVRPCGGERRLTVLLDETTRCLTREIPATNGLKRRLVFPGPSTGCFRYERPCFDHCGTTGCRRPLCAVAV